MNEVLRDGATGSAILSSRQPDPPRPPGLFGDRKRTNILKSAEQHVIRFLVARTPLFLTSNRLTAIGFMGSLTVMGAMLLGAYLDRTWLLLGIVGFAINWYGDSLDGRVAYYRNRPRKWFGFSLDIIMDWVGTATIGLGYLVYARGYAEFSAYILVVLYGWAMIIAQLRYKVTDRYRIDSGLFGPTEVRIIISLILLGEVIFPGLMRYLVWILCAVLGIINLLDTRKLLKLSDARDHFEKEQRQNPS
jgi:hypothetical protein